MVTKRKEPRPKHTHHYSKVGGKYASVWKCADPDCKHFVYTTQEYIIIGRSSFCWICREKFTLDEDAMKEDEPRCRECRAGVKGTNIDVDAIMRKLAQSDDEVEVIEPDDAE